jgi:hypothetical protein
MHLRGRRMLTQLIRANGTEEAPIGFNQGYDWNYQGTFGSVQRPAAMVQLFPGDRLLTHCRYDTTDRVNYNKHGGQPTLARVTFGEATQNEMCFNFISYYPRIPALARLLGKMGSGDPTVRLPKLTGKPASTLVVGVTCDGQIASICGKASVCFGAGLCSSTGQLLSLCRAALACSGVSPCIRLFANQC